MPLRARLAPWLSPAAWLFRALAARAGEAFCTAFAPGKAHAWLARRGAAVRWDKKYADIAAELQLTDSTDAAVRAGRARVLNPVQQRCNSCLPSRA